jgi:hypothetical protein
MRKKGTRATIRVMKRAIGLAALASAGCLMAACGTASAVPAGPAGLRGDVVSGQLTQVSGSTLTLSTATGGVTVTFTGSTSIEKTGTGTDADITTGSCITATGTAATGSALTATTVTVSPSSGGTCSLGGRFGGGVAGGPFIGASFSPRPLPSGIALGFSLVRGLVTAVSGTSVTVRSAAGTEENVVVPSTATVSATTPGISADLVDGVCVTAVGPRGSSGDVAAQSLDVEAPGPSGCPSARGGGFGGSGGGGFGGSGGGGFGGSGGGTTGL